MAINTNHPFWEAVKHKYLHFISAIVQIFNSIWHLLRVHIFLSPQSIVHRGE